MSRSGARDLKSNPPIAVHLRPWAFGVAGLLVTLLVWQWIAYEHRRSVERMTNVAMSGIMADIESDMKSRTLSISNLAMRWAGRGVPTADEWAAEARQQIDSYPGYQAIEWIDPSFHVLRTYPISDVDVVGTSRSEFDNRLRAAVEAAGRQHGLIFTPTLNLPAGGRGFVLCTPVYQGAHLEGFIAARLRYRELFDDVYADHALLGYTTVILEGDEKIFGPGDPDARKLAIFEHQAEIRLPGVRWQVRVWPGPDLASEITSKWNEISALCIGSALSLFLTITLRQTQAARRLTKELGSANKRLSDEIVVRNQVTETLRQSEERFRTLFDQGPVGMAMIDHDLRLVRVNRALCRMLEHSEEELTGLTISDITHPDDIEKDVILARKLLVGDLPSYQKEKRYLNGNGKVIWVNLAANLLRDSEGNPLYGLGVLENITERKHAEDALQASKARLAGILDIAAEGVISVNSDQQINLFNRGAEQIFGYAAVEVLGKPLNILVPERFRARHRQQIADFASSGETARLMGSRREVLGLRKNNEEFPLNASISKLEMGGETILTVILRDITETRRAEEALRKAQEELEMRVRVRTRALAEATESLVAEIKERRRAEAELQQLSARLLSLQDEERRRIARELHDGTSQYLAAISIHTAFVQQESSGLSLEAQEALASCAASADECLREIRNLSYLLHPPLLDDMGLVAATGKLLEGFSNRSSIRVKLDVPPDFPRLPDDLEIAYFRIIQESLSNIYRYSGSPTAAVRFASSADEVILEVVDEGGGIPAKVLDSGGEHCGRIGVGIAGMRARMRQLGGHLEIISGAKGTTVRARLKREPAVL